MASRPLVRHVLLSDIEGLFIELNFRKLGGYYSEHITHHVKVTHAISIIDKALDTYINFDRVLLVGDFNTEISENAMDTFLYQRDLRYPVKKYNLFQKCK